MKKLFSLGAAAFALLLSSCADHYSYAGGYSTSRVSVHSGYHYPVGYRSYGYYPTRTAYIHAPRQVRYQAPNYRDHRDHRNSHQHHRSSDRMHNVSHSPNNYRQNDHRQNDHRQRAPQRDQRQPRQERPSNRSQPQAGMTMASYRKADHGGRSSAPSRDSGKRGTRGR
ncbi:hypothetical protein [Roseibacillus persicicus]|uniref:hypothetical protein n=1 Tax=Roseibacillus persicicus TaxID=454148 RepID=UPI00280D45B0|nr:hypothetical protein [Roseibacillus persicicus]MDQ8190758.1 hypothetical protein [Roseibacillus persicicus]